jgi:hypothetical protein
MDNARRKGLTIRRGSSSAIGGLLSIVDSRSQRSLEC